MLLWLFPSLKSKLTEIAEYALTCFEVSAAENLKTSVKCLTEGTNPSSHLSQYSCQLNTFTSVFCIFVGQGTRFCLFITCLQHEIIIVLNQSALERGKMDICLCVNVADHNCNMNLE